MIAGRPSNQWIGLISAAAALIQVLIVTLLPDINPITVATVIGSVVAFLGVGVAFVAGQPPTVNSGDQVKVVTQTPAGQPNVVTTTTV